MRSLLVLVLALCGSGCDAANPADRADALATLEDSGSDGGPVDAARAASLDAHCVQNEPDPDRTVRCSTCNPACDLTREQPRSAEPPAPGLEYDESLDGLRLAQGADGAYLPEGRHERIHDGTIGCDPRSHHPIWQTLDYALELPEGTSVDFELRGAWSMTALSSAMPIVVPARAAVGQFEVGAAFLTADVSAELPFLSITVVLHASPDGTRSPVFHHYDLRDVCLPVG